jgi:cyclohexanone monooxygenase
MPAHNGPLAEEFVADWHRNRAANRTASQMTRGGFLNDSNELLTFDISDAEREREYQARWDTGGFAILSSFADFGIDAAATAEAGKFVDNKIRAIVKDPKVADLLVPHDHPIGTKRLCVDSGYYATFNRDNVTLIDIRTHKIEAITPHGLRTSNAEYRFDNLILATGFDAMTGALDRIDIRGRGGVRLRDEWAEGPKTYLGLMVSGFPNMFMITGPGSPSVLTNMLASIEQHVDWITDCLGHLQSHQQSRIEPTPAAQAQWVAHVNETAHMTLAPQANSWYMGANVPGKPRMFMPYVAGLDVYRLHCADIAAQGYSGFTLSAAAMG